MDYEQKYLKYKAKYLQAKQEGGAPGGHLQVFFLTDEEFTKIQSGSNTAINVGKKLKDKNNLVKTKTDDYTNIYFPGLGIHHHTHDSGFKNFYPYINEHEQNLHYVKNNKNFKVPLGGNKFDYYNLATLSQVIGLIKTSAGKSGITKMILVRDYTLLHDVFVCSFTLNMDGEKVTGITIDPVTAA